MKVRVGVPAGAWLLGVVLAAVWSATVWRVFDTTPHVLAAVIASMGL